MSILVKRTSTGLLAIIAIVLSVMLGQRFVRAQDGQSAVSPMSYSLISALGRVSSVSSLLLPDGRTLTLSSTQLLIRAIKANSDERASLQHITLPGVRRFATATVMPDGRVLIWGGINVKGHIIKNGLWFDPATDLLTVARGISLLPRAGHTAILLSDGSLLIVGGWSPGVGPMQEAEIWNPRTDQSQFITSPLVPPRLGLDATLLQDGRVALRSGIDPAGQSIKATTVFDPANEQFTDVDPKTLRTPIDGMSLPTLAALQPKSNAKDFPANGLIALRFSESMDPASINAKTITLLGPGGDTPIKVIGAENGRLAFITPAADLYPSAHYTLFLQGVMSQRHLGLPFTGIDFSVTAQSAAPSQNEPISQASAHGGSGQKASSSVPTITGQPPSALALATGATSSSLAALHLTTGTEGETPSGSACGGVGYSIIFLCRASSLLFQGAWYPGQDAAGDKLGGHWRLNKPDMPAKEIAHAILMSNARGGSGPTGVSGRVELIDGSPIANVDLSIGAVHVRTNAQGSFTLAGVPAGRQTLFVNGTTANTADHEYGQFVVAVTLKQGLVLPLDYRMYLPRILDRDKINIPSPTTHDLVITHPDVPGLEIHIPAGTVIRDYQGKIVRQLAIVPTPVDRAPFPLADNFSVFVSLQPGGATIQNLNPKAPQGIQVFYPNYQHFAPGTNTSFYIYDLADGWNIYGNDHVTPDGLHIAPNVGVFVHKVMPFGGGLSPPPKTHPGDPLGPLCGGQQATCPNDPIDLWNDTLEESQTDARINDVVPISLAREFDLTSLSSEPRAFGGWRSNYDMYIYSPDDKSTDDSVRLPDGHMLNFTPIPQLPGEGYADSAYLYTGSPSKWDGATLEDLMFENPRCIKDASCFLLTLRDGTQFQFGGEDGPNGSLRFIRDRFGNQVELTYNGGLLQQITSPSGRFISLTYNSDNHVAAATDSAGRTWTYNYTKHVQTSPALTWYSLDSVTYPDTTAWQFTYQTDWASGSLGTLSTMTDRDGHQIMSNTYTQISGGQTGAHTSYYVTSQTLADGSIYSFARTPFGSGTQEMDVTDPNGHVRQVVMDPTSEYPVSETHGAGTPQAETTTYVRNTIGLVQSMTDALGRETDYTYDAKGNVTSVTRLAGTANAVTEQFTWTPDYSQVASYTDALGHTTTFTYTDGCLTGIVDPLGDATAIVCNAAGQPLSIQDALGNTTQFVYQGYDLRSVTDALGRTTTHTTDPLGRVIAVNDPLGDISRREYDLNDRVVKLVDPMNAVTTLAYDGNGNVASVTLPNTGTIHYTYDVRNRLVTRKDALNQSESWTYDGLGNVLSHTDRKNQLTTYQYDPLNRRVLTTYADGSTVTPSYDAGDRLTGILDSANGNQSFGWDGLDRLTQAVSPQGTVGYGYDAAGRRTDMLAGSQAQVNYTYDAADRLTQLKQGSETVSLGYDAANRRTSLTLPNGVVEAYGYDNANELTVITYTQGNGTSIGDLAYTYDNAGRRISQTGSLASDTLPTATTQNGTFDLNNRQTGFNGNTLNYDADGNLTDDGTHQYVWNARNQLAEVKQGTLTLASYGYDALGRRQSKAVNGADPTSYLYDGLNPVQEMQDSTVTPVLTGLGIDEYFGRTEPTGRTYLLTDALGNTIGLTDTSGNLVQRYQYSPYGEVTAQNTGFTNPYQFTGRENDGDGLYYYRARYYSQNSKNFVSEDPLGLVAGPNGYRYVNDNPAGLKDPLGYYGVGDAIYYTFDGQIASIAQAQKASEALRDAENRVICGMAERHCYLYCLTTFIPVEELFADAAEHIPATKRLGEFGKGVFKIITFYKWSRCIEKCERYYSGSGNFPINTLGE